VKASAASRRLLIAVVMVLSLGNKTVESVQVRLGGPRLL